MVSIELQRKWNVGLEIANGGFGRIYEATDENDLQAVIKLVPKVPGASRELLFEPVSGYPNIIPIWDSGEWENFYVLVMPRAEKSLRQHLGEAGGKLTSDESLGIFIDVAEALAGLQQDVVHRDLKPDNILLYQGHWCLADFGIARYAEATTAPDTHKYARTAAYAAPEQWRDERATSATDVYAFGVTAFELLQGHRPFPGPDYREQHLNQPLPSLEGCSPTIASLITECLYKAMQARPTPANILARLRRSQQPSSPAARQLAAANQMVVAKQALAGASDSAQKSIMERRKELFSVARQSFEIIFERLVERIRNEAPSSTVTRSPYLTVQLGSGVLSIDYPIDVPFNCLIASDGSPAFDVIAYGSIKVSKPRDQFGYEGRSHSLWFCDAHEEGVYHWFETAFMVVGSRSFLNTVNPFALSPRDRNAALAFSQTVSNSGIAWEPLSFDQGDEEQFIERWLEWFAAAVDGGLHMPSHMPENSGGHHRSPRSTLAVS